MNNFLGKLSKKNIKAKIDKEPENMDKKSSRLFMHLSLRDKILFIKQLSILIKAGLPLLSSLNMLKQQTRSKTMAKILNRVIFDVENGQYLATALSRFRRVFGDLTISVVSVGEISGTLGNNLNHLVVSLKKQQVLKRKVISAFIYPAFIVIATLSMTILMTVFFFPKIIPVLKSISYQLPWTTKSLIYTSELIKNNGLTISFSLFFSFILAYFLLKIRKVHFWYDKVLISAPFLKKLVQTYNIANIARTFGLLQNSGVEIVRSFHITSNATANLVYKKELDRITDKLARGEKISNQMIKKSKLFPLTMSQMVAVGENTGKLSETFLYVSDIYEEEMDDLTKNLSIVVEPILLIFMGLLVGFVAISIIIPIYGITQNLRPI